MKNVKEADSQEQMRYQQNYFKQQRLNLPNSKQNMSANMENNDTHTPRNMKHSNAQERRGPAYNNYKTIILIFCSTEVIFKALHTKKYQMLN